VRVDVDRVAWTATAALLWPTQGAFEESANPTLDKVRVASGSLTLRNVARGFSPAGSATPAAPTTSAATASELQFFAHHYRDRREITARPDNTILSLSAADISISTLGASQVGSYALGPGRADSVLWIAGQLGDWYGVPHRTVSLIAEGGYQWRVRWQPWIRAGMLHASGDRDPSDARHGTFFPMLPSTKPDLLAGTFAQMNLRDVFAELRVQPHRRVEVAGDVRKMSLLEASDHWYSGTGATARRGSFFGFLTRPAWGSTDLGVVTKASVKIEVNRRWTISGSFGTVTGGQVVRRLFAGDRLTVFSLESVLTLD
ncbi:MAG: alginate export family protein, partial [Vicinamibacterales bacterium]